MYFIDKRIQVICDQLKLLRIRNSRGISDWDFKKGLFFRPEEADAADTPWEKFDSNTMRWYSHYDGSDQFEGKFEGYQGDFHGIQGVHYWFRGKITIPQELDGKSVWMKIGTQIEEWDDGKNPQFLVFINNEVVQGADMNHRDILLSKSAVGGETLTVDIRPTPARCTWSLTSWWICTSWTRTSTGCTTTCRFPCGPSPGWIRTARCGWICRR